MLISPDGKRFEIVQVVGKALGMRSGRVGSTGKTVGRAFATVQAAKDAARARVAELTKQGFKPGSAVTGAAR